MYFDPVKVNNWEKIFDNIRVVTPFALYVERAQLNVTQPCHIDSEFCISAVLLISHNKVSW